MLTTSPTKPRLPRTCGSRRWPLRIESPGPSPDYCEGVVPKVRAGRVVWACVTAAVFVSACSSTACTTYAGYGLIVNVVDGSGNLICDATVIATDHDFSAPLLPFTQGVPARCSYSGVLERVGTYSITVTSRDLSNVVNGVRVDRSGCHVKPVTTTIVLSA